MFHPEIKDLNPVKQLREDGKLKEALQIVLELEQGKDLSLKELLTYKLVKANLLLELGNYLDAIEIAKEIFQEFQKLGDLISSFDALLIQAYSYMIRANITQSEDIIRQVEDLFELIKASFSIDLRERESFLVRIKAGIHYFKGEIQQSLELNKKAYELAKDTDNKAMIAVSLNNIADKYYHIKEYDKAIKYAKEAFKVKNNPVLAVALGTLIEINVSKGDIKEAKVYLDHLRELSEKFDSKWNKTLYYSAKALILKSSLRARDRIKAEDIFKELAMDNTINSDVRIPAIINLCDLYLTELRITNDPDIINEIYPYIQELLSIAEKQHLYLYLAETYILQAKLSLLTLDLNKAKRFLTQAQEIAELYGLKRLAMKISYEHDELLRQTKMWENLKISQVSMPERLELSGLNDQMENMLKKQMIEVPEMSKEDPVMLLILTEGGNLLFSKKFVEDFSFEDDILGGFLTTINYIISEVFSEGLDRAVFGPYTLLMMPIKSFLICYIFTGYSYFAHQKIKNFLDSIQNDSVIWQSLQKFFQKSKSVQLDDVPSLELLITEIFVEKKK
ncbi:MAG: tetratricopeptide repeat protein [Candidatus Lokiarchaeota archaeon]|nr:tetratricopeptide repeat protein [Candidatus Lokiarchaeota archaeon]